MLFRNALAETVFYSKYAQDKNDTWGALSHRLVEDVCGAKEKSPALLADEDRAQLAEYISKMYFIPGGRYLYYAGRPLKAYNNCFLLRAERDTREEWADLAHRATSCLMLGGGIGVDYSRIRPYGSPLKRTGGVASGPLPLMNMINEIGRNVMQGGSRRSAIYASLSWKHQDVDKFLEAKNWPAHIADWKRKDFNSPAQLDMTNISLNYDDSWLENPLHPTFLKNVEQALSTGEPGFSFNFRGQQDETLRNACTEVTSADDSDVCNLGSVNLAAIPDLETFKDVVRLGSIFLVCGTVRADLPYEKVYKVREKNRRLGLGLMGMHEWLLSRGKKYIVDHDLHNWLGHYKTQSTKAADDHCDLLSLSKPIAYRAIAPTGTIGILAGTTTGIEPLYAVAYKRRYLRNGTDWHYQYVVDSTAKQLIDSLGISPDQIETATDLAADPERRIRFQADVQDYVDHGISSTINLPSWGSPQNNSDKVQSFSRMLARYASRIRGFTCYPDGSRGGQPITTVSYKEALGNTGIEYVEKPHDVCTLTGKSGVCGS